MISTNSVNSMGVFRVTAESTGGTVAGSSVAGGSGIRVYSRPDSSVDWSSGGRLGHPFAKSTAALASTTPNPYSWLKL